MRVFVTGATGYIGAVVTEKLCAAGHEVAGLARSDESARKLERLGAEAVAGDLRDSGAVAAGARRADAAIHLAMEPSADAPRLDRAAVDAILAGLGSAAPFLYTSGIWVMGSTGGHVADEGTPVNPTPFVAWRPGHEDLVLHATSVRGIVIRPAMVYGRGGGFPGDFARQAKDHGVVRYVGSGKNRWPFVHVDDLADLYILALAAGAGSLYFASAGPSLPVKDVAHAAAAAAAGARVEAIPLDIARRTLGPMADALTLDQLVSAQKAVRELGWNPQGRSLVEELSVG
ncbi:MAG: NAD-dependent epimerase/dehydratase family protein [Acidobacteriia bacterium]|nr:NAD-dependent epimerase/dehydratase family protein [Terriglobia bacterium]